MRKGDENAHLDIIAINWELAMPDIVAPDLVWDIH
jgi:hypothetical protein